VLTTILALALAGAGPVADRDDEPLDDDEPVYHEPSAPRLRVGGTGGMIYDVHAQKILPFVGGEVAWAFEHFDVGVLGQAYRFGTPRASSTWTPVVLARFEQRFETRRDLEAIAGIGIGAGKERGWAPWFQFTAGFRALAGPLFLGGEFGFEQDRFFRLGATAGVFLF
jgi:hypothetical protein